MLPKPMNKMKMKFYFLPLAGCLALCPVVSAAPPEQEAEPQPVSPARSKEEVTPLLKGFADSKVFYQQLEIAKKIVALNDASVLDGLTDWLKSGDRHDRGNAAFIFASLGDERGFDVVGRILADRSVRPDGKGLSHPGGSQIVADRYYAVHLLGELKGARSVDVLVPFLDDPDVNYKVAWALGEIGDRRAIKALTPALNDKDALMRVSAIQALEKLKAKEALPAIVELLDDQAVPSAGVQVPVATTAKEAIAKLEAVAALERATNGK